MEIKIFDANIAIQQAGGSEDLARDLFTMLLAELPEHKQAISEAFKALSVDDSEHDPLWDPVHKLHGACSYLGVPALLQAAKDFEHTIKENNREKLANAFNKLDAEIQQLLDKGHNILGNSW